MERVMGIGPTQSAWEAGTLPLSYTRTLPVKTRLNKPSRLKQQNLSLTQFNVNYNTSLKTFCQ